MKRSEINQLLRAATELFAKHQFELPPFAAWTPEEWQSKGHECDEIRQNLLGWDLTDFGSNNFFHVGLLLFTLRNGNVAVTGNQKTYAEKIMIVRPGQVTPMHFHWSKMEDIINRGGGELAITMYRADPNDDKTLSNEPFDVSLDGVRRTFNAGDTVRLAPGASITLEPYLYHTFWAEGDQCLVGEVSSVNDDTRDNCFLEPIGRFPAIEEDEPPLFHLCTEYPDPVA